MIDPRDYATEGLFPGRCTTFGVATLGILIFEAEIKPERAGRGAGTTTRATHTSRREKDKYKVTIRVRYGSRIWEYEAIVREITANVIARLLPNRRTEPEVVVNSVATQTTTEPTIKVYRQ